MPIDKRQSKDDIIAELISSYKKTGKIGNTKPRDMKHAREIASGIAYSSKKESHINNIKKYLNEIDEKYFSSMKSTLQKGKRFDIFKNSDYYEFIKLFNKSKDDLCSEVHGVRFIISGSDYYIYDYSMAYHEDVFYEFLSGRTLGGVISKPIKDLSSKFIIDIREEDIDIYYSDFIEEGEDKFELLYNEKIFKVFKLDIINETNARIDIG